MPLNGNERTHELRSKNGGERQQIFIFEKMSGQK